MQNPWAALTKPGGNEEAHEVLGEKRGNYEVAQAQSAEDDVRVYSGNRRFRPAVCAMADQLALHDCNQVVLNLYPPQSAPPCSFQPESCSVSKRSFHKVLADLNISF